MDVTSDISRLAEQCAAALGLPQTDDVTTRDVLEQVTSDIVQTEEPWLLRSGMRLAFVRKPLLVLLRPFTERLQRRENLSVMLLALMADEVVRLQARVDELEATNSASGHIPEGQ